MWNNKLKMPKILVPLFKFSLGELFDELDGHRTFFIPNDEFAQALNMKPLSKCRVTERELKGESVYIVFKLDERTFAVYFHVSEAPKYGLERLVGWWNV
jgi:hypothetical protein